MASKPAGNEIGDTEQLEWLAKSFHGLIIGKKASGLKELTEQTGAKATFLDDKCVVTGKENEVDRAKLFISQKVKKQEMWLARKKGIYSQSCVPDVINICNNDSWEVIDVHPRYYKFIADENLQTKFGVNLRLRKEEKLSHIIVKGSSEAKNNLKKWFEEFVSKRKEMAAQREKEIDQLIVGADCETISVENKYFGRIIGKEGSIKKGIEEKHNVVIIVDHKNDNVHIKGNEEARNKTKVDIQELIFDNAAKKVYGASLAGSSKGTCYIGLPDNESVDLCGASCHNTKHTKIGTYPRVQLCKTYDNIGGLKEILTKSLERAKGECEKDPYTLLDVMIHYGIIHYMHGPGAINVSSLRSNLKRLEYERFSTNTMNFKKLEKLPVLTSYTRFDMKIFGTNPTSTIRYKIYIKELCGKPSFINIEETDVPSEEMLALRVGPGYFCHPEHRYTRVDVIDPSTNVTTRVNISIIQPNEEFSSAVRMHSPKLKDFLENIKIKMDGNDIALVLPQLNTNYKVIFMRRCERRVYKFEDGFSLRTSTEEILSTKSGHSAKVIDVFYKSDDLDRILSDRSWTVNKVQGMLENELKFSETMAEYLL